MFLEILTSIFMGFLWSIYYIFVLDLTLIFSIFFLIIGISFNYLFLKTMVYDKSNMKKSYIYWLIYFVTLIACIIYL